MNKRHFYTTVLLGLAVFTLAFTTTAKTVHRLPPAPAQIHLIDEKFPEWQYTAIRDGNNIILEVNLSDTTIAGLEAFRDANRRLAQELMQQQKTLTANVVLKVPISVEGLADLVDAYGLQVISVEMRIIDGYGDRVTLVTGPEGQNLTSQDFVHSTTSWVQEQTGSAKLSGVVSLQVVLQTDSYDLVLRDPSVFMVDVTHEYAEYHFHLQHASLIQANDAISAIGSSGYWYVEDNQ